MFDTLLPAIIYVSSSKMSWLNTAGIKRHVINRTEKIACNRMAVHRTTRAIIFHSSAFQSVSPGEHGLHTGSWFLRPKNVLDLKRAQGALSWDGMVTVNAHAVQYKPTLSHVHCVESKICF